MKRGEASSAIALALAALLHGALLALALHAVPATGVAGATIATLENTTFDVDSEVAAESARPSASPGADATRGGSVQRSGAEVARSARTADREPVLQPGNDIGPPAARPSQEPPAPGANEYDGPPSSDGRPRVPGLGGAPVWSIPGAIEPDRPAAAPTASPGARPTPPDVATTVLDGTMRSMDREKGVELSGAGVIARALEEAAHTVSLPHDCRAQFEAQVSGEGQIVQLVVLTFTAGNSATWNQVATRAWSSLAARRVALTGRARRGAVVAVRLESKFVFATDLSTHKTDVISTSYEVRVRGEERLPADTPRLTEKPWPWRTKLPDGIKPVQPSAPGSGR